MSVPTALVACRLVHDAAAMLLWGAFAYVAVLVPAALAQDLRPGLATLRLWAVAALVLSTVAILPIETAATGSGWADAADPATAYALLFETSFGPAWLAQFVTAALLVGCLWLPPHRALTATAVAAGLALGAVALTGHAAMHDGWKGLAHRLNDGLHLLVGGGWLGALVPLLAILRALDDPARRADAGLALRRFSAAGHGAVALVLATGVGNMLFVVGGWPLDGGSLYQRLLLIKIALVLGMVTLALVNRYAVVPRFSRADAWPARALRLGTLAEIALGAAVLGLVALFGTLEPH